jgi:hypothetical protein
MSRSTPTPRSGAYSPASTVAPKNQLTINDQSTATMRDNRQNRYFAFVLYSLFSVAALWFPLAIAIVTTISWIFWLALGVRMKHA